MTLTDSPLLHHHLHKLDYFGCFFQATSTDALLLCRLMKMMKMTMTADYRPMRARKNK